MHRMKSKIFIRRVLVLVLAASFARVPTHSTNAQSIEVAQRICQQTISYIINVEKVLEGRRQELRTSLVGKYHPTLPDLDAKLAAEDVDEWFSSLATLRNDLKTARERLVRLRQEPASAQRICTECFDLRSKAVTHYWETELSAAKHVLQAASTVEKVKPEVSPENEPSIKNLRLRLIGELRSWRKEATLLGLNSSMLAFNRQLEGRFNAGDNIEVEPVKPPTYSAKTTPEILGIVVLENQLANESGNSGAPSAMAYPFGSDPRFKKRGSEQRTLFIWGKNLPKQGDEAELKALTPHLSYQRKTGDLTNLLRSGWTKAKVVDKGINETTEALIVEAKLEPKVVPGIHELTVNGAAGNWALNFNNQTAVISFVRERDDARQFPAYTFYTNDTAYVDVVYDFDMPLPQQGEEVPQIELKIARRRGDQVEIVGLLQAKQVENQTRPIKATFRAGPIQLYDAVVPDSSEKTDDMSIAVRRGERLVAAIYDEDEAFTTPSVAIADIKNGPKEMGMLWSDALKRTAQCYAEGNRIVDDNYAREQATRISPTLLTAFKFKRTIGLPGNPFDGITVKRNGISIGPPVQAVNNDLVLRKGDHAAAILIANEYLRMSESLRFAFDSLKQSSARMDEFRAAGQRLKDPSKHPFWGSFNVFYPGSNEIRIPLWQTLDAEKRPQDFKQKTPEEANRWALGATASALTELAQRMKRAEDLTREAESSCNLEQLLVLAGQDADPVVARIVPRLVREEQKSDEDSRRVQWVPDNLARAFVENLAITGSAVRALENYSTIDDVYKGMAIMLAAFGAAYVAGTIGFGVIGGSILVGGDAVDAAVFGVKNLERYRKGETQYEIALGAAPILGESFLEEAEAARGDALSVTLGFIAPGLGIVTGLKLIANVRAVKRGRALLAKPDILDRLKDLKQSEQMDIAAFYADLHRRGAKDTSKLSVGDRAAFNKFQNYFDRAGLPKTDTTAANKFRNDTTKFDVASQADDVSGTATTRIEPPFAGSGPITAPQNSTNKFIRDTYQKASNDVLNTDPAIGAAAISRQRQVANSSGAWERLTAMERARVDAAWSIFQRLRNNDTKLQSLDQLNVFDQLMFSAKRQRANMVANNPIEPEEVVAITAALNGVRLNADELARAANVSKLNAEAAIRGAEPYARGAGEAMLVPTPAGPRVNAAASKPNTPPKPQPSAGALPDSAKQPSTIIEKPQPSTVIEPKQPTTVIEQPQPSTVIEPKQPTTVIEGPQPSTVIEPKRPTTVIEQPQPSVSSDAQPSKTIVDRKPAVASSADAVLRDGWKQTVQKSFEVMDVQNPAALSEAKRLIDQEGLGPNAAIIVAAQKNRIPVKKLLDGGLHPNDVAEALDDYLARSQGIIGRRRKPIIENYLGDSTPQRFRNSDTSVPEPAMTQKQIWKDEVESRLLKLGVDKQAAESIAFQNVMNGGFSVDQSVILALYERRVSAKEVMRVTNFTPADIALAVEAFHARYSRVLQGDRVGLAKKVQAYLGEDTPANYLKLIGESPR